MVKVLRFFIKILTTFLYELRTISVTTQITFRPHISRLLIANKRTVYFVSVQNRNVLIFEVANFKLYFDMNVKFRIILLI